MLFFEEIIVARMRSRPATPLRMTARMTVFEDGISCEFNWIDFSTSVERTAHENLQKKLRDLCAFSASSAVKKSYQIHNKEPTLSEF